MTPTAFAAGGAAASSGAYGDRSAPSNNSNTFTSQRPPMTSSQFSRFDNDESRRFDSSVPAYPPPSQQQQQPQPQLQRDRFTQPLAGGGVYGQGVQQPQQQQQLLGQNQPQSAAPVYGHFRRY